MATGGLYCFAQTFSSFGERGLLFRCKSFSLWWRLLLWSSGSRHIGISNCSPGAWRFQGAGSGAHGLQQLWPTGPVVSALGSRVWFQYLWHRGLVASLHVESPGTETEPVSPASTDGSYPLHHQGNPALLLKNQSINLGLSWWSSV